MVPTLVSDEATILLGRVVPVSNDAGISPADKAPTVVKEEVTILLGRAVPVNSDAGTAPATNVPTVVMLERFDVDINVPLLGSVTEVVLFAFNVTEKAPVVTSEERFANVKVAEVAGAVIVTLFNVVAIPFPTVTSRVELSTKSFSATHEPKASTPTKKYSFEVVVFRKTERSYCAAAAGRDAPA